MSARAQPLAHADPLLDGVAQPPVEGDDLPVGGPHLEVDLGAARLRQPPLL